MNAITLITAFASGIVFALGIWGFVANRGLRRAIAGCCMPAGLAAMAATAWATVVEQPRYSVTIPIPAVQPSVRIPPPSNTIVTHPATTTARRDATTKPGDEN